MVLKTGPDWPVELVTSHQFDPKKTLKAGQNRPKLVKNHVKLGTGGKFSFAPGLVFKTMVVTCNNYFLVGVLISKINIFSNKQNFHMHITIMKIKKKIIKNN